MKSIIVLLMLMAGSIPAWAVLGEDVASVNTDTQVLGGQHIMVAQTGFNVHQITMKDGSIVKEFASPSGAIFGISWQTKAMPKLDQLLGTYMINLQQGVRTQVIRRRGVTIQGDNFVYTNFGRMHFFKGRAYVPGLVPANLTPEVVQ